MALMRKDTGSRRRCRSLRVGRFDQLEDRVLLSGGGETTALVIDNGSAGYAEVASWWDSSLGGFGGDSRYARPTDLAATASWTFAVTPGSTYRVAVTWPAFENRATNAQFMTIDGTTPVCSRVVNQRVNPDDLVIDGVAWEQLGFFTASCASMTIRSTNIGSDGIVGADAVRLDLQVPELSDTTAPVVTSRSPTAGASDVAIGSSVTATFSEAVQSCTIGFELRDSSGSLVDSAVTYDPSTRTVTLDPSANLVNSATYTATISGAADLAGNTMAALSWTFTTPLAIDDGAAGYEETGSWRTSVLGGFAGDSRYAWPTTPEATASWTYSVTPGSTYRVAVTWPAHENRATNALFTIHDGTNSVVTRAVTQRANPDDFVVDGVAWEQLGFFTATSAAMTIRLTNVGSDGVVGADAVRLELQVQDTVAPAVTSRSPAPGGSDVAIGSNVTATFSEAVQSGTLGFELRDSGGTLVNSAVTYDETSRTVSLDPSSALAYASAYTARIHGVRDLAGNVMMDQTWEFATAAPPDKDPPVILSHTPLSGQTVAAATLIMAVLSEPIQADSLAVTVTDSGGVIVPGEVVYDPASLMVVFQPSGLLAAGGTFTVQVGSAVDLAGNAMAEASWTFMVEAAQAELDLTTLPLLQAADLQYVGAFRVPRGKFGESSLDYGGTAIAFNPANNSLFIVGHDWHQAIGEISIPDQIVNDADRAKLATATVLQPFVKVLGKAPNYTLEGTVKLGGLQVIDGTLVGTAYEYYDGDLDARASHFRLDSLDLDQANVTGLFQVGELGGGFVGGFMTRVPDEWRDALGMPYLTGQAALSVIGRTSLGPAAFGFDPAALGANPTPIDPYLYYPQDHPTLGAWGSQPPTLFNMNTRITGVVFVPETRSVLFFGSVGTSQAIYGTAEEANDPYRGGKGTHALNGEYSYQIWAYDALDFLKAKDGDLKPWEVVPYSTWSFDVPQFAGGKETGGVAYDPATGRLYVAAPRADQVGFDPMPLIQVYQLPMPGNGD